jgi:hypothetical protein
MPRVTDNMRNAQALAEFSNLKPEGVQYFRNNYPDFVPQGWWDYDSGQPWNDARLDGKPQWQITQVFLRDAWENQFKEGIWSLIDLLRLIFNPDNLFTTFIERMMREPFPNGFPEGITADFSKGRIEVSQTGRVIQLPHRSPYVDERKQHIPMQRAIVYLFENSWRARFCAECKKRFVAAEPKTKFCSEPCSHENRIRQERESWHKNKAKWRPTQKKLRKARGKGKQ